MAQDKYEIKITRYIGNLIGIRSDYGFAEYSDEDEFLRDNLLAFVLMEEEAYKAYIIYSDLGDEGEIVSIAAPYNYGEHVRELLEAVGITARCNGNRSVKITVNATREIQLIEELSLAGYKKVDNDNIEYILDASRYLLKSNIETKHIKNIVPFYKVPIGVMLGFDEDNKGKLTDEQDYKNVVDINPELSIAYVEEKKLKGYLICKVSDEDIILVAGYVADSNSEVLKAILGAFKLLRGKLYPGISVIRVKRFSDNVERFVKTFLDNKCINEVHIVDYRLEF